MAQVGRVAPRAPRIGVRQTQFRIVLRHDRTRFSHAPGPTVPANVRQRGTFLADPRRARSDAPYPVQTDFLIASASPDRHARLALKKQIPISNVPERGFPDSRLTATFAP